MAALLSCPIAASILLLEKKYLSCQIAAVETAKSKQEIAITTPNPAASRCRPLDRKEERVLSPAVTGADDGNVVSKSWEFFSQLTTDVHHRSGWRHKASLSDVMPLFLAADCVTDKVHQFVVRCTAAHESVQIMVPDRKKARADLSVGSDPNTAAVAAEWSRDGRNDSDLPDTIFEHIASRCFTRCAGHLDQWEVD